MPKRDQSRRVPASLIRDKVNAGQVQAAFKAGAKLIQLASAADFACPAVKNKQRALRSRNRMRFPKGSFLNARWVVLGPGNPEWDLIDKLSEEELKRQYIIVRVEEFGQIRWVRLIYEVVSSRSQLLRQRVHIREKYARERIFKSAVLEAVERELDLHLTGKLQLPGPVLDELASQKRELEHRVFQQMTRIQARLGGRDALVYLDAWAEIEQLRGHHSRLIHLAADLTHQMQAPNFAAHIWGINLRLSAYVSFELWLPIRWARYHLGKAATLLQDGRVDQVQTRFLAAADHLQRGIDAIKKWSDSLTAEEKKFIAAVAV